MIFYSHSRKLPNGRIIGTKKIREHWVGVFNTALLALEKGVSFRFSFNEIITILEDLCRYHDLGKYTEYFRRYLLKIEKIDRDLRAHAHFGAYAIFMKYQHEDPVIAALLYFIIAHHHSDLKDILDNEFDEDLKNGRKQAYYRLQKDTIKGITNIIRRELEDERLEEYLDRPDSKVFYFSVKEIVKNPNIQNYFLVNYLFSLLIETDKLDASGTSFYILQPLATNLVDIYRPVNMNTVTGLPDLRHVSQDQLRGYCRLRVNQYLFREDWHAHRLFTLTAPTGIGKTLTALDFALKLRALLREREQREARIIYASPFINIIEQVYKVYEEVFDKNNMRLLAHYQYADTMEQTSFEEERKYNQRTMLLDTWQCDVVITTFVQFFQTLIGNRNKMLKKFNHFAGAIIILDEVQTIRLGQLPLIGAVLYFLSKFLNARIILMTATKPKIFELANQEILKAEGEEVKSVELLPDNSSVFSCFSRTRIISLLGQPLKDEEAFMNTVFFKKWKQDRSCLIVCNTVKRSLDLYKALSQSVDMQMNPVFYLSTNIIPLHRKKIIDEICRNTHAGRKSILIATQCIEAGVDLDFDMGFRDLGPIDSIIQVAGRINRNNHPDKKYSPLYIVDFGDCSRIYDTITHQQAEKALTDKPNIPEEEYLSLVDNYFSHIAANKSFQESRQIFSSMKRLKYISSDKMEATVSSFRIIDEKSPTLSVFIELDGHATLLRHKFTQLINKELSMEDFSSYKKAFNQYILSVPAHLPKAAELAKDENNLLCEGMYIVSKESLVNYYNENTGFDRNKENRVYSMSL